MKRILLTAFLAAAAAGCSSYRWTSGVPGTMRTVGVPTFRNRTDLAEIGAVSTRQLLREFQREGTFKPTADGAAVEIQGEIVSVGTRGDATNYKTGSRLHGGLMTVTAKVSVIDKVNGRVLIDNRKYTGEAPYSAGQDNTTAYRDASGRVADDLARRIVDDVVSLDFKPLQERK